MSRTDIETGQIPKQKKEIVRNLYLSGISKEFIAMQVDLDILQVTSILREMNLYKKTEKKQHLTM